MTSEEFSRTALLPEVCKLAPNFIFCAAYAVRRESIIFFRGMKLFD
jgi:hypothetical protein